jgi:hypothetical protein
MDLKAVDLKELEKLITSQKSLKTSRTSPASDLFGNVTLMLFFVDEKTAKLPGSNSRVGKKACPRAKNAG